MMVLLPSPLSQGLLDKASASRPYGKAWPWPHGTFKASASRPQAWPWVPYLNAAMGKDCLHISSSDRLTVAVVDVVFPLVTFPSLGDDLGPC